MFLPGPGDYADGSLPTRVPAAPGGRNGHALTGCLKVRSSVNTFMLRQGDGVLPSPDSFGGVLASTQIAKPEVHAEVAITLVKQVVTLIVANDDNYALAA